MHQRQRCIGSGQFLRMKTTKRSSIKIRVYFIYSTCFDSSFFPSFVKAGSESSGMDLGDLLHLLDSSSVLTKDGISANPLIPLLRPRSQGLRAATPGDRPQSTDDYTSDDRQHAQHATTIDYVKLYY